MALALKLGEATRTTMMNVINTDVGTPGVLEIRSGAPPATPATADSGTLLATITLPDPPWISPAVAGVLTKSASAWSATASGGAPTDAGHFRFKNGATVVMQGTAGVAGDTPDLVFDNKSISTGQTVTITTFTLTAGNA